MILQLIKLYEVLLIGKNNILKYSIRRSLQQENKKLGQGLMSFNKQAIEAKNHTHSHNLVLKIDHFERKCEERFVLILLILMILLMKNLQK